MKTICAGLDIQINAFWNGKIFVDSKISCVLKVNICSFLCVLKNINQFNYRTSLLGNHPYAAYYKGSRSKVDNDRIFGYRRSVAAFVIIRCMVSICIRNTYVLYFKPISQRATPDIRFKYLCSFIASCKPSSAFVIAGVQDVRSTVKRIANLNPS